MIECVIPRGSVLCTRVYLPLDSPKYMYTYIALQSWSGTAEWIKVPYTDDCWTFHFLSLVATYVCQSQRELREAQWQAWSPSSSQHNQWTSGRAPVWCMHVHIFPRGNMYTTFLKKRNVWYSCRFRGGGSYREQRRRPKVLNYRITTVNDGWWCPYILPLNNEVHCIHQFLCEPN